MVSAPVTTYGAMATYTCNSGFAASGPSAGRARLTALERQRARLHDQNCGTLTGPTNGAVSASVTTFGSTASYTCNTGYTVSGAATRTCQADGTWRRRAFVRHQRLWRADTATNGA